MSRYCIRNPDTILLYFVIAVVRTSLPDGGSSLSFSLFFSLSSSYLIFARPASYVLPTPKIRVRVCDFVMGLPVDHGGSISIAAIINGST